MVSGMERIRQRNFDTVIFDLDGTLLDTLADLTDSVNTVLARYSLPQYSTETIRGFVGNGIRRLMQLTIPDGETHPQFEAIYNEFREYYNMHCMDCTEPYPGILLLLDELQKDGYKLAIVSNKADSAVKILRDIYFRDLIPVAIGESQDCRKKPAPDSVYRAMEELGADQAHTVYIGDSDVDLRTAENAGIPCILVSWGFRDRDFLLAHGALESQIASDVNKVKEIIYQM